jgi:hypothetical protein
MGDQPSSYDHKEGEFIINSKLLQQPLRGLEEVLYNITFDEVLFNAAKNGVDIRDIMGAYIEMLVSAQVWPEERNADRPKFKVRYALSLNLLDPIFLQILDPKSRKVVSCGALGWISQPDIKITCLDLKNNSSYEILYPMENMRSSLLNMLYLIHRRGREVFKDPDISNIIDDKTIIIYELHIKARMYLTQKPNKLDIEVSNRTPIFGTFWYDNGRSKITTKYELVIPGYLFIPIPKS